MDKRDFFYATSIIKLLRKYKKEGWVKILNEERLKLEKFLKEKGFTLQDSIQYDFTIKKLPDQLASPDGSGDEPL